MKISYLGIPGSNSYTAAKHYFGEEHEFIGVNKFADIYTNVLTGQTEYGIIPVENNLAGSVAENYDLLQKYDVHVVGEYYLKFDNHLLGVKQAKLPEDCIKEITQVVSHPQPLAQCYNFFLEHPWMQPAGFTDTAAAAKYVAEQKNPAIAAIGNADAAQLYGLSILQRNIADDSEHNYTRFFAISRSATIPQEANKCSLIFTLPHIPGSLVKALAVFASNELNLVKIESRPIHGKMFEYFFYVDIGIDAKTTGQAQMIIEEFRRRTQTMKVLGFYKSQSMSEVAEKDR